MEFSITDRLIRLHANKKVGSLGFSNYAIRDFEEYMTRTGQTIDDVKPQYRYMFRELMGKQPSLPDDLEKAVITDDLVATVKHEKSRGKLPPNLFRATPGRSFSNQPSLKDLN